MTCPARSFENDHLDDFFEFLGNRIYEMEEGSHLNSIGDISELIFKHRQGIMGRLALSFIEKNFGSYLDQEYCPCPICDKRIKANPKKVHREIETMIGSIELERPYFYCKDCKYGFYPLDEALGLSSRKKQHDIQATEAFIAAESPYEVAAETFERCTGITLSNHHIHDVTNEIAKNLSILDVCPTKEEVHHRIDSISEGKLRRPVLMIGIDGAHVPVRPEPSPRKGPRGSGDWQEAKGFRIYLIENKRIVHLLSWHQIQSDKELAADLLCIKCAGLIPEKKVRIGVIGDGAPWIWNRIQEIFPKSKKVLDFYHCSEYLYAVANIQYGRGTQEGQVWVESILTQLFLNRAEEAIAVISSLESSSSDAKLQIEKTVRYLSSRIDKINYGSFKRGGYHIGSGGIESSNKFISNVRLKRSGAWWYPTNANNILKLRCAKYNGTYDRIVLKIREKDKSKIFNKRKPNLRLIVNNSSRNR